MGRVFKVLHIHPWSIGITLETFHYPETVQIPYSSLIEEKPTTIGVIIYKHSTQTKLRHRTHGKSEEKVSNL